VILASAPAMAWEKYHHRLNFKWQGFDARLTGVLSVKIVKDILA
jgi:hypothetical protein